MNYPLTKDEDDRFVDVLWFLMGWVHGNKSGDDSPFDKSHLDALERARAICQDVFQSKKAPKGDNIAAAVRTAVAAERERCAALADKFAAEWDTIYREIPNHDRKHPALARSEVGLAIAQLIREGGTSS